MANPIDGYLVDDLIVYRGLQKGGYVGLVPAADFFRLRGLWKL
jgi:hypothetical protein